MFTSRNRTDLMIEVWESLDCESVGAEEIIAIEKAVEKRFGPAAVDSPMVIARLLADEGAVIRHPEIMKLYVDRSVDTSYDAALRNAIDLSGPEAAERSIKRLDNLRTKYISEGDNEGLRRIRESSVGAREGAAKRLTDRRLSAQERAAISEAVEWISIWLASPEVFATWVEVRRASTDFRQTFATPEDKEAADA